MKFKSFRHPHLDVFSLKDDGFSLVEIIFAASIGFVILMAFTSLMLSQQKEVKRLGQKVSLQDIETQVRGVMATPAKCLFNLNPTGAGTFDASSIPSASSGTRQAASLIAPAAVYDGTAATARKVVESNVAIVDITGLVAGAIGITNWVENGPDNYTADIAIPVASDSGILAPVTVRGLNILTTGTASAKRVVACGTSGTFGVWVDRMGSRALNTVYTNTTGKPLQVAVTVLSASGGNSLRFFVDGMLIVAPYSGDYVGQWSAIVTVPPGSTYEVGPAGPILTIWRELL